MLYSSISNIKQLLSFSKYFHKDENYSNLLIFSFIHTILEVIKNVKL